MKNISKVLVALTLSMTLSAAIADDAEPARAGRWEFSAMGQYSSGDQVEHSYSPGFILGYNFNDHWNLNLNGSVGLVDAKVDGVKGEGSIYTAALNVDYHFLTGKVTPFVSAGVGIFNWDAKENFSGPSAFSVVGTGVSYSGAVGVRWEMCPRTFLRAAYRGTGTSLSGVSFMNGAEISLGWKF